MSKVNQLTLIKIIDKLYLSLMTFHTVKNGVMAFPAESKSNKSNSSDNKSTSTSTSSSESKTTSTTTESKPTNHSTDNDAELGSNQSCQPNTNSCGKDESCIRFDSDPKDQFTCHETKVAFCESSDYCKEVLGENFKYCYIPPWANNVNQKKQCFTEHGIGSSCISENHCVNNLSCIDNICVSDAKSDSGFDFDGNISSSGGGSNGNGNDTKVLGINRWVFISMIALPLLIILFCIWCWIVGRRSSKNMENEKKSKYENELKKLTLSNNGSDSNGGNGGNGGGDKSEFEVETESEFVNKRNDESLPQKYINPQKEIEEEVGKRGFRSLFRKKKNEIKENNLVMEDNKLPKTMDISSTKIGGKAPINSSFSIISDTHKKKYKKNLTLIDLTSNKNNAVTVTDISSDTDSRTGSRTDSRTGSETGSHIGMRSHPGTGSHSHTKSHSRKDNIGTRSGASTGTSTGTSTSSRAGKAPSVTSNSVTSTPRIKKTKVKRSSVSTPSGSRASSVSTSSVANTPGRSSAKIRVAKKKTGSTGVKKTKKGNTSYLGNDTNANISISSKQSSQRGLINNTSSMSSALSGQSASYFSNVSALDAQSAIYYQQMYNVAAAQAAAAQNPYYAAYMQSPSYYAAAAQQNAAAYYAAAAAAASQNPNASLLYGNYQNSAGYR